MFAVLSDPQRYADWVVGAMRIDLRLAHKGAGTRLTMIEQADGGLPDTLENPVTDAALAGRNAWSLRRLKEIAEGG